MKFSLHAIQSTTLLGQWQHKAQNLLRGFQLDQCQLGLGPSPKRAIVPVSGGSAAKDTGSESLIHSSSHWEVLVPSLNHGHIIKMTCMPTSDKLHADLRRTHI